MMSYKSKIYHGEIQDGWIGYSHNDLSCSEIWTEQRKYYFPEKWLTEMLDKEVKKKKVSHPLTSYLNLRADGVWATDELGARKPPCFLPLPDSCRAWHWAEKIHSEPLLCSYQHCRVRAMCKAKDRSLHPASVGVWGQSYTHILYLSQRKSP